MPPPDEVKQRLRKLRTASSPRSIKALITCASVLRKFAAATHVEAPNSELRILAYYWATISKYKSSEWRLIGQTHPDDSGTRSARLPLDSTRFARPAERRIRGADLEI